MQEKTRKRKTQHSGVRGAVITLLILACLTCAGFLGYYVFQVETIEVEGNHLFTGDEIIGLSGVCAGDNLFSVSADQVEEGLKQQPYISLVSVERKWPSTIILHVKEREAVAAVSYDKRYLLVAQDTTVLKMQTEANDYIVVDGMGVVAAVVGATLQGPTAYQIHVMDILTQQISQSACAASISTIDLRDPAAMTMTAGCGITIRLGTEENLQTKFTWIENLLPRLEQEGKRYGVLDVSGSSGASYIP